MAYNTKNMKTTVDQSSHSGGAVLSHIVFNDRTTGSLKQLPDHWLNKVTGYQRKQADLYFKNPDFVVGEDEPEFNILSLEYVEYEGLRKKTSDLKYFQFMIHALIDTVDRDTQKRYLTPSQAYNILREEVENPNGSHYASFKRWLDLVTKKNVFGIDEIDMLFDYMDRYYQAMKLIHELLTGGLWGSSLCSFGTVEELQSQIHSKIKVLDGEPHNKYK